MREKISACITAGNEEVKIRRCLESVAWCDEIVVVDSFSSDRTVEICREYTSRVYQHKWLGYIGQKNLIRDMAQHPWALFIDADEEVSPDLRAEIMAHFERGNSTVAGYQFPRLVYYLGRWIRHGEWYPDTKLRLFRREQGRSAGREPHDHVLVDGPVVTLRSPLYHYTYDDISDHIHTTNRFSTITACEKYKEGQRANWFDLVLRPYWRFLKAYFFKGGFRDGRPGLLIAQISSFGVRMKYYKMWELARAEALAAGKNGDRTPTPTGIM
ncbi:MAG: glycosyltransferase family 2 protein [Candidatus Marinimicrobia bacterium]|nr:glycosyltransferase family 2 protein [Candidatus Neomarinimicrobiota bacterium]